MIKESEKKKEFILKHFQLFKNLLPTLYYNLICRYFRFGMYENLEFNAHDESKLFQVDEDFIPTMINNGIKFLEEYLKIKK